MLDYLTFGNFSTQPGANIIKGFFPYFTNFRTKLESYPALTNVCGKCKEPTLELSTLKVLHSVRLKPNLQT